MDKKFLLRLENTLKQIKSTLLLDKDIRKLLFYESSDIDKKLSEENIPFDTLPIPDVELVKDNIFLQPIVEVDNQPPYDKKMFISITCPNMGFTSSNAVEHTIKISIQLDKTNWVFNKDQIRVYHLAQLIINALDGKKYDCALNLVFEQMVETITDKTITGKSLLFSLGDGVGD